MHSTKMIADNTRKWYLSGLLDRYMLRAIQMNKSGDQTELTLICSRIGDGGETSERETMMMHG